MSVQHKHLVQWMVEMCPMTSQVHSSQWEYTDTIIIEFIDYGHLSSPICLIFDFIY